MGQKNLIMREFVVISNKLIMRTVMDFKTNINVSLLLLKIY